MLNGLNITSQGNKYWYKDSLFHRENGPAIELTDGYKKWYINGQLHREDGPAIEYANGYKSWHLNGERIHCNSNEEFLRIVKLKAFL